MAGLPGGAAIPGGIPTLWAPAPSEVGQQPDTTTVLRAPTYVPRWTPRFNYWGKFTDYLTGSPPVITSGQGTAQGVGSATAVGEGVTAGTQQARAPTYTPTWQRWRLENLGWRDYLTVQIIPPEASQHDWPNPRGARRSVDLLTWTQSARLIGAVISSADGTAQGVGSASGVSDAPVTASARAPTFVPTWRRHRIENLGWTDHLTVQIIPPEGNQKSWPNPRGPQYSIALRTWIGSKTPAAVVLPPEGRQHDWPNPRGPRWPISLRTWVSGRQAPVVSTDGSTTGTAQGVGSASAVGHTSDCLLELEDGTGNLLFEDGSGFLALELCNEGIGTAQGVGSTSGVGAAIAAGAGTAQGVGSVSGVGASTAESPGTAQGVGRAMGISDAGTSTGSAQGVGSATATGAATGAADGTAQGVGSTSAVGQAVSGGFAEGAGTAQGVGSANGVSVAAAPAGGAGFVHRFTRKRWRELEMLIAAEKAAQAKAARVTTPAKKEPLLRAAAAAELAVQAAIIEGENARLDRELVRNANAIRAAIRAATVVKEMKAAAQAIEISRIIAKRQAENEEDEMIMLLMMS